MDNTQTLELQIKSTAEGAIKSVKLLNNSLTNTKNTVDNVSSSINKMSKAFSMGSLYVGVKRLSTTFLKWMDLAIDRTEQLNLFNVVFKNMEKNGTKTFSTLGRQATQFQNKLNEAFGTNLTETTKYQALFQSMGENVGIPDTYSALMSTTMTKLTYDLASLYNKQESVVAEALRAGVYAGQTKPLRSYGIDVTQTSMQPILDSLGITDRSVKQMSQAEKEILRYLATLKQAKVAMGDFANTVESPANQLKVFKQQLTEAKVALSSLFIGTFAQILPYANALLMVVKEVAKAIADMFDIELTDYNSGIASSEDAYAGLTDSIDDATESAKELKRQTLGFDQINNINENKDSGSSDTVGGIDQRLLDAIYGYDNGMDKVRMKATEIRDRIMEWLGFTKEIDPLTGEIGFKYQGFKTTLKNILKWFSELSIEGKVLTGIIASLVTSKVIKTIKSFSKLLGTTGLFKVIKSLLTPMSSLINWMKIGVQVNGNLNDGLEDGVDAWRKQNVLVTNADGSLNKWKTTINGATTAVKSLATSAVGLYTVYQSMQSLSEEGTNLINVFGSLSGSLMTIAGLASAGSVFGPIGTAIGATTGVVATFITTLLGLEEPMSELDKKIQDITTKYDELRESMKTNLKEDTSEIDYYQNLYAELQNIVDENGKIKSGYEDRANFIVTTLSEALGVEISILDGQIVKYDELEQSIKDVITQKRAQIMLEEYEKLFVEAKKDLNNAEQAYGDSIKQNKEKQKKYNEILSKYAEILGVSNDEIYKIADGDMMTKYTRKLNEADISWKEFTEEVLLGKHAVETSEETLKNSKKTFDELTNTIDVYEKAYGLAMENNWEALDEFLTYEADVYGKSKKEMEEYYNNKLTTQNAKLNEIKKNREKYDEEEYEQQVSKYESLISLTKSKLEELNTNVKKTSPTVSVNADTSSATNTINSWINKWKNKLSLIVGVGANSISAKANGGAFYSGNWHNIEQYANGGAPSHGSLFVAGEAGAELVGHVNGRTEVLNQSQIASTIYNAVLSAMSQSGGQSIVLHVHSDEGVVVDKINQRTKQTGVCPINIPSR